MFWAQSRSQASGQQTALAPWGWPLGRLPRNHQRLSKALRGDLDGYRAARCGDYWILVWIDEDKQSVLVRSR